MSAVQKKLYSVRIKSRLIQGIFVLIPVVVLVGSAIWIGLHGNQYTLGKNIFKLQQQQISFFEDAEHTFTIDLIAGLPEESFKPLPAGNAPNFGFNTSSVWLRFELHGRMTADELKLLEVKNPLLNTVELYERNGIEIIELANTGDAQNFSTRNFQHRNYVFPIQLPSEKARTYYLKLGSGGEQLFAPLTLWTGNALAQRDSEDQMVRGCYFGLILFVLLFNLFIYLIIRERSSLYYVHYNLFLLLLQLSLGGYAFQYLWPGSSYLANVANPFFASLSVFALMRFAQHFLELKKVFPRVNRAFHYVGYVLLANAALCLIPLPSVFFASVIIVNGTALLLNFAIIPTAIGVLRRGYEPAKIFLAGFLLLVLTVFGFLATNAGLIHSDFYADYGLLIGSAVEVILLSLAIVVRFKQFKEQAVNTLKEMNVMQREQNQVLEKKVVERTFEIEQQKEEILSSIRYAERIQKNVLPSAADVKQIFPESFIIYEPKDIVSGDFYWVGKTKLNGVVGPAHEVLLFATGDCTGHGVPGAMVSVLGCNLLRETVLQYPEEQPHTMLHKLDERLLSAIGGTSHEHAGDGMDIALWALQTDTMELRFAGANNGISIWRKDGWTEFDGTRRPLGLRDTRNAKSFETHSVKIEKGDTIYCWTDGITDQIGGSKEKKLKTKGLREFLTSIATLPLKEQEKRIKNFITEWRGDEEQLDDICLSAVRI